MREAFTYMFKDNCFKQKAIIYLGLGFVSNLLIAMSMMGSNDGTLVNNTINVGCQTYPFILQLLGLIFNIFLSGYFINCIEAISKQSENIVLPFFNLKTCFTKGFKFTFSIFITTFCIALIILIIGLFEASLTQILSLILGLIYITLGAALLNFYAQTKDFWSFFKLNRAIKIIKKNPSNYFSNWLILVVITISGALISLFIEYIIGFMYLDSAITMFSSTILTSIIATYVAFVSAYLIAKSNNTVV